MRDEASSPRSAAWHVGVDIGGTFTDVVAIDAARGTSRTAKVRSVMGEPVSSLDAALSAVDLEWADVSDLMHGTTMATNAMVEDKLARVALIATKGFRDILEIGRQNRRELYRLDIAPKLPALVPEALRFEVDERLGTGGVVLVPLTEEAMSRVSALVADSDVQAVAIALLHAYANPAHEAVLAERLGERFEHVVQSHRVNPEAREYERTCTTVLNAALAPLVSSYIDRVLERAGNATRVHLFHSAGGMASPAAVKDRPLALALSGPAAGVSAAGRIAAELGLEKVISFDMGGTTTDVCLVLDGVAQIAGQRLLAERPMRQPMVAVESIGAGGGSIARIDSGAFRVGPESAGAAPGPACYGAGGGEPTVTDANLVLGYLSPRRLLGGEIELNRARAKAAIEPLAAAFGVSVVEASRGIHRVANANMARALKRVTVERGVDARGCVLVAYGGAGPMHAVDLARTFGIARVVVPRFSSAFSALGCLTAELSYSQQQTVTMSSLHWSTERLGAVRAQMLAPLSAALLAAGYETADLAVEHVAAIRYEGQSYAVDVPFTLPLDFDTLDADFKAQHHRQYGFTTEERWELESLRIRVAAPAVSTLHPRHGAREAGPAVPITTADCWFDRGEPWATPRFERDTLPVESRVAGPAVIEDEWSTIVVNPGAEAWADASGHLHIDVGGER